MMRDWARADDRRMGYHVDGVKFAGGSFSLFPEDRLRELIDLCHENNAYVSTVSKQPDISPYVLIPLAETPSNEPRAAGSSTS